MPFDPKPSTGGVDSRGGRGADNKATVMLKFNPTGDPTVSTRFLATGVLEVSATGFHSVEQLGAFLLDLGTGMTQRVESSAPTPVPDTHPHFNPQPRAVNPRDEKRQ